MSLTAPDPASAQRDAANPAWSVWVAASAGTGKTKVLTDRVLNLLLGGSDPGRILALTFTKAAAAEMANRLNQRLSVWAVAGDEALSRDIETIAGRPPDEAIRIRARQMFARVLDQAGGMRILTIHAFCQSLLRRFPLEAGVAPQFELMDERGSAELLAEAQARVLQRARTSPGGDLAVSLGILTSHLHEEGFSLLLKAVTLERGRLSRLIAEAGGLDAYLRQLRRSLGLKPHEDEAAIRRDLADERRFDGKTLRRAAALLAQSNKAADLSISAGLAFWLEQDAADRAAYFDHYADVFLTDKRTPRVRLATKAVLARDPVIAAALAAEQARIEAGWQRLAAAWVDEASTALTRIAAAFLDEYAVEKQRRALVDYDDLILYSRDLLHRPGIAPWVLYKLDGGIDHILIDEAQDTNPDQWAVVAALAEEFFSGIGARAPGRTIFAVGDAKQSIFSFQRADPRAFVAMRAHFRERAEAADEKLVPVPLTVSFRSTEAVLAAVDAVFAAEEARAGVALDGTPITHAAFRRGQAGLVELWPAFEPEDADTPEPWRMLAPQQQETDPQAKLAGRIADTIRHWLDTGEILQSADRPIRAGDILVLVRRRTGLIEELMRRLKRHAIPVAGSDRMVLTEQIAVMDLVALGRFLLLPEDDLTLATVLKSPLIGLDEDELYALAHGRPACLWEALRRHPAEWAEAAAATLQAWLARADFVPPFELYADLLGAGGGRHRLQARLGRESNDAIDEFLAQALAYGRDHAPSLQGFLAWLEQGENEIKRDLDTGGRDEVRIMTVHGSKGLQAPIVFLPDTVSVPTKTAPLLWPEKDGPMLFMPRTAAGEPVTAALRTTAVERRNEEYRRLLYVAMTRAADRLYIGGWRTQRNAAGPSWYDLIETGMLALTGNTLTPIKTPPGTPPFDRPGFVYTCPQSAPAVPDRSVPGAALPLMGDLPGFAISDPPPEPVPARPLTASRPTVEEPPVTSPLGHSSDRYRFRRGLLIHRLLQSLPDLPEAAREAAARRFLARQPDGLEPELQASIAAETLAVLADPALSPLFGAGSRAEVPIVGLLPGPPPRTLQARVDRLVVTDDHVMVVDYKTNRPPPSRAEDVAPIYREQLRTYRTALSMIYPGRRVRTFLLWTDGPRIMEIDAEGGGA